MKQSTPPAETQRVEWDEERVARVGSVEELDALLDDLSEKARTKPFIAELIAANGDSLAIGLGLEESVLSWVSAGGDPPYYASQGRADAEGTVVFFYRGSWSEFPNWSAVPTPNAREAMAEFFRTGRRPGNVDWAVV